MSHQFRILATSIAIATAAASAGAQEYSQSPTLDAAVEAGDLAPVAERLPEAPMVVEPLESVGTYGGVWNAALTGSGDKVWLTRTVAYENLVRWDPEWTEVIPNVAESYEVSEDGTTFTFNLRRGLKWSDGDPFDTADIDFAWNGVLTNSDLTNTPSWLQDNDGLPELEIVDEATFRLVFSEPKGLLMDQMAHGNSDYFTRYPVHYLSQFHPDYSDDIDAEIAAAGVDTWVDLFNLKASDVTPSYSFRNIELPTLFAWTQTVPYDGSASVVTFERNPYYFKVDPDGQQLPYIEEVRFQVTQDREVTLLKAIGGELDFQWRRVNSVQQRPILFQNAERGGYNFHARINANMNEAIIYLNLTTEDEVKREMYRQGDFRRALSLAIDRRQIIDTAFAGLGDPYQAAPRPESVYYDEEFATQYTELDLDRANELLDGLGYGERDDAGLRLGPDGQPIRILLEMPSGKNFLDVGPLLERQLEEVGIDLEVREIERSLYETKQLGNSLDAGIWEGDGGLGVELDPRWYFPYNAESGFAPLWSEWYMTEGADGEEPSEPARQQMELFDQITSEPEQAERERLMGELMDIAKAEFWVIGLVLPAPQYGVTSKRLYNVPASFPGSFPYPDPAPTNPQTFYYGEPRDLEPYQ